MYKGIVKCLNMYEYVSFAGMSAYMARFLPLNMHLQINPQRAMNMWILTIKCALIFMNQMEKYESWFLLLYKTHSISGSKYLRKYRSYATRRLLEASNRAVLLSEPKVRMQI